MKIITINELDKVDPANECFIIKKVFDINRCDTLLKYLSDFSNSNPDNARQGGENWHYWVTSHGNNFDSFLFQDLNGLNYPLIKEFYRQLFHIYGKLGEHTHYNDFDMECSLQEDYVKTINPLIFWYKAGISKFGWHKHPADNQKFQLLCNLTVPGVDYSGGETLIYMGKDKPTPNNLDECETFGANFEKGDVFGFPYSKWHKVNDVKAGAGGITSRVSLLMPLAKRKDGGMNEYIDEI